MQKHQNAEKRPGLNTRKLNSTDFGVSAFRRFDQGLRTLLPDRFLGILGSSGYHDAADALVAQLDRAPVS